MDKNSKVKAAVIMDEISVIFFAKEWEIINLTTTNWYQEIYDFSPDVLFVESAWRGADGLWGRKLIRPDNTLWQLIYWCRQNSIVTVFWSKEDPIHFNTFIKAAKLFDWVFTTDLDCIPMYQSKLKNNQVGLLLFAAAVPMFNPMEEHKRKEAIAFAGSYYRKRQKRCEDFEHMYDWSKEYLPIVIYDRKSEDGSLRYKYPLRYQKSIRPSKPIEEIPEVYKEYEYHFTINTVTTSSTMEARRIFELMACNTLVISNECKAVHILFGDLVLYCNSEYDYRKKIKSLPKKKEFYNQCRLKALRKTLMEHTFNARIKRIEEAIWNQKKPKNEKTVVVIAQVSKKQQYHVIKKAFDRQSYPAKELLILSKEVDSKQLGKHYEIQNERYYALFNPKNYYGENYLLDLMLATRYSECGVIGKGCYFIHKRFITRKKQIENRYRYIEEIEWDRCIMTGSRMRQFLESGNGCQRMVQGKAASIDEYNFCAGRSRICKQAAERPMDCGHAIEEIYEKEKYSKQ